MSLPIRVLHVEDDPAFADLTATFLEREAPSLSVQSVQSVESALVTLTDQEFDCVVSDYDMPELTGLDLLKRIRRTNEDLPVILFTGKGSEEIASEAISTCSTVQETLSRSSIMSPAATAVSTPPVITPGGTWIVTSAPA